MFPSRERRWPRKHQHAPSANKLHRHHPFRTLPNHLYSARRSDKRSTKTYFHHFRINQINTDGRATLKSSRPWRKQHRPASGSEKKKNLVRSVSSSLFAAASLTAYTSPPHSSAVLAGRGEGGWGGTLHRAAPYAKQEPVCQFVRDMGNC